MNPTRAREILQSEKTIQVTLDGTPVWIDEVNEQSDMAVVHPTTNPNSRQTVPVGQLQEEL